MQQTTTVPAKSGAQSKTQAASGVQAASYRLWEIDTLRGTAVITMVIYHLGWNLASFGLAAIQPYNGFWYLLQRYTCISFIGLAGLSLTLTDRRLEARGVGTRGRFWHFVRRGLWVFFWGMVITVAVYFVHFRVDFGVLHLIGVATILAFPFLRRPWLAFAGWVVLFVLGYFTQFQWRVDTHWLVWLGFFPENYQAIDYFPLIPWFGVTLLGVALGNFLYPNARRAFALPDWSQAAPVRGLRFLGRHSLPIYLLHQPVLFGLVYLVAYLRY